MILTTPRLILREFADDDWPAVLAYQSDPQYLRYYSWSERTPEDVQHFVERFVEQQQAQPRTKFQLAIILRAEERLIGNCGLRLEADGPGKAEIGYELAPGYWRRGLATEAAHAMIDFGFGELRLHRISAWCIAENVGSARVLEKLGMRQEGYVRESEWMKGRWWETLLYGILDHEWATRDA